MTDAVLAEIRDELRGIRAALESLVAPPEPPTADALVPGCLHPQDKRIDFGMTDGVEDWQCGLCGYRTVSPEVGVMVR